MTHIKYAGLKITRKITPRRKRYGERQIPARNQFEISWRQKSTPAMNSIAKSFRKVLSYQVATQKPINAKIRTLPCLFHTHKFSYHSLNPAYLSPRLLFSHLFTVRAFFNAIFILLIFLATLLYSQSVYK